MKSPTKHLAAYLKRNNALDLLNEIFEGVCYGDWTAQRLKDEHDAGYDEHRPLSFFEGARAACLKDLSPEMGHSKNVA